MDVNKKIDKYIRLDEQFQPLDNILDDITYDEIHTTVYSNIPKEKIDVKTVMKEFEKLLNTKVKEARFLIRKAAPQIVKETTAL